jgi:hypothetical protein
VFSAPGFGSPFTSYVGDIRPRLFGVVNVAAHEASMLGEEQYKRSNPRKHYTQLRPAA